MPQVKVKVKVPGYSYSTRARRVPLLPGEYMPLSNPGEVFLSFCNDVCGRAHHPQPLIRNLSDPSLELWFCPGDSTLRCREFLIKVKKK